MRFIKLDIFIIHSYVIEAHSHVENKHAEADNTWQEEPSGVGAEPGEIETDLFAKILADLIQRLALVPSGEAGPLRGELPARTRVAIIRASAFVERKRSREDLLLYETIYADLASFYTAVPSRL